MTCNGPPCNMLLSLYERSRYAKYNRRTIKRLKSEWKFDACAIEFVFWNTGQFQFSAVFCFLSNPRTNVSVLERMDKKLKTVWNLVGWPDQDVRSTLCLVHHLQTDSGAWSKYFLKFWFIGEKKMCNLVLMGTWAQLTDLKFKGSHNLVFFSDRNRVKVLLSSFRNKKVEIWWNLTPCQSQSEPTRACGVLPQDIDSIILDSFHPIAIYKKDPTNQQWKV